MELSKICPITNAAEVERTVFAFSFIKNKFRSRLTNDNCNNLLFVY